MTTLPHVLILTEANDPHVDMVLPELEKQGCRWSRFDPNDLLHQQGEVSAFMTERGWSSVWCSSNQRIDFDTVTAVWWRRPTPLKAPDDLPPMQQEFVTNEARYGLLGLLRSLPTFWVNHPAANHQANFKPTQLQVARHLGFHVPPTLLTNEPDAFRQFYDQHHGNIVYKMIGTSVLWDNDVPVTTYTQLVTPEMLQYAEQIRYTTHLFQAYVPKRCELRVIVMGENLFAVEIHNQQSTRARIDWRMQYADLRYEIHTLPMSIQQRIHALMRHFGLVYGAIDMIITPEAEYQFLEINANGQFAWLDEATGLPLFRTLAALLARQES